MEYLSSFIDQLDSDYISHHGIKGMKWGVRRYQNTDGSLTAQGKKRYNNSSPDTSTFFGRLKQGHLERKEIRSHIRSAKERNRRETGNKYSNARLKDAYDAYEKDMNDSKMTKLRNDARKQYKLEQVAKNNMRRAKEEYVDALDRGGNDSLMRQVSNSLYGRSYYDAKKTYEQAEKDSDKAWGKYKKEYEKRVSTHIEKFKDIAVSDLGFDDVNRGRELLNKHNMWGSYLKYRNYSSPYSFGEYNYDGHYEYKDPEKMKKYYYV